MLKTISRHKPSYIESQPKLITYLEPSERNYNKQRGKLVCEQRAVSEEQRAENSIWDMYLEEKNTYNRGIEWKTSNYF